MSMMPAGRYKGRIDSLVFSESKEKKTPTLEFKCTVLSAVQDGEDADCENVSRIVYKYITEKTMDYLVEDLKKLGFDGDDFDQLETWDFSGQVVPLECNHEVSNKGGDREVWQFNFRSAQNKVSDPNVVKSLNKTLGSMFKMGMKKGKTTATPKADEYVGKSREEQKRELEEAF